MHQSLHDDFDLRGKPVLFRSSTVLVMLPLRFPNTCHMCYHHVIGLQGTCNQHSPRPSVGPYVGSLGPATMSSMGPLLGLALSLPIEAASTPTCCPYTFLYKFFNELVLLCVRLVRCCYDGWPPVPVPGHPSEVSLGGADQGPVVVGVGYLEEARDKMATAKDEAMDNIKAKERLEVLCMELTDTHRQLGEVIKKGYSLEEQLSMNFDELMTS
ncbi:hypothetical protein B296_00045488 [Ensete ventricosum]|uniref:Uncharacterized protein n=1 Tax=Ensete ventricosum TaxID=4639 RepID=A0A426Y4W7_ENSVE|nr:hypothetical protein B296_00045488 [Ensete ventricosum]